MTKRFVIVFVVSAVLQACSQQYYLENDKNTCKEYGLTFGTTEFANCMQSTATNRQISIDKALDRWRSSSQNMSDVYGDAADRLSLQNRKTMRCRSFGNTWTCDY